MLIDKGAKGLATAASCIGAGLDGRLLAADEKRRQTGVTIPHPLYISYLD